MFVVVYDQQLGCRWYNTETGEVGGQWGPSGTATIADRFFISVCGFPRMADTFKSQKVAIFMCGTWQR
jgi:hypothetical protein